jgi:RNA polymerase sigma factor for flagellar operon FliA
MFRNQEELITGYSGLVVTIARQYARHSGTSIEDLVSEGYVGLVQAARKFQSRRGTQFSTFAAPRIRGAILDALRRDNLLSRPMAAEVARLKVKHDSLSSTLGRDPTQDEIAGALGISPDRAGQVLGFRGLTVTSLDKDAQYFGANLTDADA